jgi:hypothetical protein
MLTVSERLLSTATLNNLAGPPAANIPPSRSRACEVLLLAAEIALIEFARFTFRSTRSEPHCIAYQAYKYRSNL